MTEIKADRLPLNDGPWFVARRVDDQSPWEMHETGFKTEVEAEKFITEQDQKFQYSCIQLNIDGARKVIVHPAGNA